MFGNICLVAMSIDSGWHGFVVIFVLLFVWEQVHNDGCMDGHRLAQTGGATCCDCSCLAIAAGAGVDGVCICGVGVTILLVW